MKHNRPKVYAAGSSGRICLNNQSILSSIRPLSKASHYLLSSSPNLPGSPHVNLVLLDLFGSLVLNSFGSLVLNSFSSLILGQCRRVIAFDLGVERIKKVQQSVLFHKSRMWDFRSSQPKSDLAAPLFCFHLLHLLNQYAIPIIYFYLSVLMRPASRSMTSVPGSCRYC